MEQLVEQNSRLVRANSVPLLQFDSGNINDEERSTELYLAVRNAGTGPARIVWFELLQDGRPVRNYQRPAARRMPRLRGGSTPASSPAGSRRA